MGARKSTAAAAPRDRRRRGEDPWLFDPLRRLLVWLVALKIAGLVLVLDPLANQVFDLPKSLYSRSLEWLLAGTLVLVFMRYGLSVVPRTSAHVAAVTALLTANVLATAFAEDRYLALFGASDRLQGLVFLVDMVVLYVAVVAAFRGLRDWTVLGAAVAVSGVVSLAYGLVQHLGLDPIRWSATDPRTARPFSTLGLSDQFGQFLSVLFALALGTAVTYTGQRERFVRVSAAAFAAGALAMLGIVGARAPLVGIAAAALVLPLAYGLSRAARTRAALAVAGASAIALAVLLVVPATPLGERVRATLRGEALRDRLALYQVALRAFADRPVLGYGPDAYEVIYPRFRSRESVLVGLSARQTSPHSWVLQSAVGAGALGLAATLGTIFVFFRSCLGVGLARMPMLALPLMLGAAAYWGSGLLSVGSVGVDWYPWVALAGSSLLAAPAGGSPRTPRRVTISAAAIVLLVAILGALAGLAALGASHAAFLANSARASGLAVAAVRHAESATKLDPGRAEYWTILGLARELSSDWRGAAAAHEEAARRAPHVGLYWSNLASVRARQALAGDVNAISRALEAAKRGAEADDDDVRTLFTWAQVALDFGDPADALRAAVRGRSLAPEDLRFERIAAEAARRWDDVSAARGLLGEAVALRESALLRVALAQLAFRARDYEAVRANASRALELDPDQADAKYLLSAVPGP